MRTLFQYWLGSPCSLSVASREHPTLCSITARSFCSDSGSCAILVMTVRHGVEVGLVPCGPAPSKQHTHTSRGWLNALPWDGWHIMRVRARASLAAAGDRYLGLTQSRPRPARSVYNRTPADRPGDHAASRNRRLRRSILARPNIERLSIFKRLICPSTGPVLQGSLRLALTAS
jgi:hypothetical protein